MQFAPREVNQPANLELLQTGLLASPGGRRPKLPEDQQEICIETTKDSRPHVALPMVPCRVGA
jgi:hypothetical protein